MPIYAYQCGGCGHEFDKFSKIADREIPTQDVCPSCGEKQVNMKLSAVALVYQPGTNLKGVPDAFKDKLNAIKQKNPGSTIDV